MGVRPSSLPVPPPSRIALDRVHDAIARIADASLQHVLQQSPRRIGDMSKSIQYPATKRTTKLYTRCPVCNDELPPNARYCIECGATIRS